MNDIEAGARALCIFENRDPDLTGDSADAGRPADEPRWMIEIPRVEAVLRATSGYRAGMLRAAEILEEELAAQGHTCRLSRNIAREIRAEAFASPSSTYTPRIVDFPETGFSEWMLEDVPVYWCLFASASVKKKRYAEIEVAFAVDDHHFVGVRWRRRRPMPPKDPFDAQTIDGVRVNSEPSASQPDAGPEPVAWQFTALVADLQRLAEGEYDSIAIKRQHARALLKTLTAPPAPVPAGEVTKVIKAMCWTYMPSYGEISWQELQEAVAEAVRGNRVLIDAVPFENYIGHKVVVINYNSLNRIVSAFVRAALSTAQPRAVVSEVTEAQVTALQTELSHHGNVVSWTACYSALRAALAAKKSRRVALAGAKREAWCAGRDAAAEVALDEDGHFSVWGEDRNTAIAQQTCRDIAEHIRALTPPEAEGESDG